MLYAVSHLDMRDGLRRAWRVSSTVFSFRRLLAVSQPIYYPYARRATYGELVPGISIDLSIKLLREFLKSMRYKGRRLSL